LKKYEGQHRSLGLSRHSSRCTKILSDHDLVSNRIDLGMINPGLVLHLALLARRYDVDALKRFAWASPARQTTFCDGSRTSFGLNPPEYEKPDDPGTDLVHIGGGASTC
jgi:hypothetical protein